MSAGEASTGQTSPGTPGPAPGHACPPDRSAQPAVPAELTPHGATPVRLRAGAAELAALRAEPAAPPLGAATVFVPGFTGSKEDFAALLDPLSAGGFVVLAVDLPGQYESPGPDREDAYLPDRLAASVVALTEDLAAQGLRVLLTGHSYGGLVCRAAVLAGAPVTGLTLIGSGPAALPDGDRRAALDSMEPVLRSHGPAVVRRLMEERDGLVQPPELAELRRRRFLRSSPAGLLGMAEGLRREPDRVDELAAVLRARRMGCVMVYGEGENAWPPPMQRAMAARLGVPALEIPGAAHSPNTEAPGRLLDAVLPVWRGWLDAAPARTARSR